MHTAGQHFTKCEHLTTRHSRPQQTQYTHSSKHKMHCSLFQRNFVQKTDTLAFHKDVPLHRTRASLRQPTAPSDTMNTIRQILQPTLISFSAPALSVPFRCEIFEQLWTLSGCLIWTRTRKLDLSLSMHYSDMNPFIQRNEKQPSFIRNILFLVT